MIFFFGTGKSELRHKHPLINCSCPNCNQKGTLVSGTTAHYFHFFFIPVFPTGKKKLAKCTHCNTTIAENSFTPAIKHAFELQAIEYPIKTPVWHGCGCLVILSILLLFLAGLVFTWFKHRNDPPKAQDYRQKEFRADKDKFDANPSQRTDSISFQLKNCLDERLTDGLKKDKFRYFCKTNDNRVLVLVEIDDMKKIKAEQRKELIPLIKSCINSIDGFAEKELYIGVEGRWNMVLTSSPMQKDLEGSYADETILYPFYDTAKTLTMDSVIIKHKKR